MKKRELVLLCMLSCMMHSLSAQQGKRVLNKKDSVKISALTKSCDFSGPDTLCCKRGKRGKTGRKGPSGRSDGMNLNELFINAPMMNWTDGGAFPNAASVPYNMGGNGSTNIISWVLLPSTDQDGLPPIGATFNIPQDLDVTQPVTAVIHMLVANDDSFVGTQAKLQIESDYKSSYEELGSASPATGFAAVQTSADFFVVLPTPPLSTNLEHIGVAVPLDTTNMFVGDWAFITVGRIAPAANEFSGNIYLSVISIQYTRLN